jgi:hypothetical protein
MNAIPKRRPEASQRFPFIPLGRAIERAKELYKVANGHEVPFVTAVGAWGFAEKSSGGAQTAAALKAFGLLEDVSGAEVRKVKLTDASVRIIRDPREISPDRDALIRAAALTPPLHRAIIEKYSGMPPSDQALKAYLLMDRGLKDEAVPEFIREFAVTMSFAKVAESATIQDMKMEVRETELPIPKEGSPMPASSASVSHHAHPLPSFPAGVEMHPQAEIQYNVATYMANGGNRIRVSADVDLARAKLLVKVLEHRIKSLEEEERLLNDA